MHFFLDFVQVKDDVWYKTPLKNFLLVKHFLAVVSNEGLSSSQAANEMHSFQMKNEEPRIKN